MAKSQPVVVELVRSAPICTVTVPAKKRQNREVFHIANDVMSGEMTQAIRDALRGAEPGKDITFNVSVSHQ